MRRIRKSEIEEEDEMTRRSFRMAQSNEEKSNKYNSFEGTQIYRLGI